MKLVNENINESIKHLTGRSEEELINLDKELEKRVKELILSDNNYILYDLTEELNLNHSIDDYESLCADIFYQIPKKILTKALVNVIKHYRNAF